MKRILVTGADGFIGRHTLEPLRARGFEVHGLLHPDCPAPRQDGIVWHSCNLMDAEQLRKLLKGLRPTHLLHLAWFTEHGRFWHALENLDWVGATLHLLRAFAESGGRRFVGAGSCAEYVWGPEPLVENQAQGDPGTLYGTCKLACWRILERFSAQIGLSTGWGRVFLVYGPGEKPGRLLPSVVRALQEGRTLELGPADFVRDWLYVADLGNAFAALVDSGVSGPVNLASGEALTIRQFVDAAAQALGLEAQVAYGARPSGAGDPPVLLADVTRLRRELAWQPAWDLHRALPTCIQPPSAL